MTTTDVVSVFPVDAEDLFLLNPDLFLHRIDGVVE